MSRQNIQIVPTSSRSEVPNELELQKILTSQYLMEKRGKTLKNKQYRKFIIKEGKLFQLPLTQNQQYKQLPVPYNINMQSQQSSQLWSERTKDLPFRLFLQFQKRTPIYVYFRTQVEALQIQKYLSTLKNDKEQTWDFMTTLRSSLIASIVQNTSEASQNMLSPMPKTQKPNTAPYNDTKTKAILGLMNWFQFKDPLWDVINQWVSKSEISNKQVTDTLRIKVESVKSPLQLKLSNPIVKLWIMTESRQLSLLVKHSEQKDSCIFVSTSQSFTQIKQCNFSNEFQLELSDGAKKWKSQRMRIIDILRIGRKIIRIPLTSTHPYPSVLIRLSSSQLIEDRFFIQNKIPEFTPANYSVIEQMIGSQFSDDAKIHHQFHIDSLMKHSQKETQQIQFFRLKKYIQSLQIQSMIQKCYANQPVFKTMSSSFKGTVIYTYYVKLTKNIKYYDVEKLLLEHGNIKYRRLLNTIKRFDNALRINFSSHLYYLVDKIVNLVNSAPEVYWSLDLFEDNHLGKESVAFFILIILIFDIAPNYYMIGGKGLASNSLLMHYTTKVHLNNLYYKLSELQLNIQTLFGQYSVSLLSELIQGEAFYRVLDAFILQAKTKKYQYNLTMIGLFLSLLSRMQKFESVFESPQNFIFGLKLLGMHVNDLTQFCYTGDLFIEKMKKIIIQPQFQKISNQMKQFYRQQQINVDIPNAMIQFFTQFPENQQKIEKTNRQIHFCINKIEINGQCPKLTLYLFQNKARIFEKQFVSQPLRQLQVNFGVTLDSLNEIIIAVYQDQKLYTEFCQINPRKLPSNYMFQLCLPVQRSKRGLLDQSPCYICFQVVITEQSPTIPLEAKVPPQYGNFFFETETKNKQIASLNKFVSLFKMSPNNYNNLYSKLGWYNNHYIIPAERLINIHRLENNDILELPESDTSFYYQMNKYSRSAFGRAIICSRDKSLFIQSCKNGIKYGMVYKLDMQKSKGGSNSQLACYALQNIKMFNPTYLQFFYNAMDLPLIDYLTYNSTQYDVLPDLLFAITLGDIKSTVIFSSEHGNQFQYFNEAKAYQIENTITYRRLKLKSKHIFNFPQMKMSMDNFLYQLRLNIFYQIISVEPADNKTLTKWPSHIIIKANQLTNPLVNMTLSKFLTLIYQTKYNIIMQFVDLGKPRNKKNNALSYLKTFGEWRKVQVLCEITSIYKYFFIEDQISRKRLIVKQTDVIPLQEFPKVRISCEEAELTDPMSQIYKKIEKIF